MSTSAKSSVETEKKPLVVKLKNRKGEIIEGVIPGGELPDEDPGLAIARILGKYKHIKPTRVRK